MATPTIDINGNAITTPSPTEFGVLQDVTSDITFDIKELYGQSQFPVAIGRGKGKIALKAKFGQINGLMLNNLVFGQSYTNILLGQVKDLVGTAVPTTPFTITPTVPNSGTWLGDMGVTTADGKPLTRVVSGPTTGQYSVAAGVYTFAAADTGIIYKISFQYTSTSTLAKKIVIPNALMGVAPTFRVDLAMPFNGKQAILTLNACTTQKFSFATKLDDFMIPEIDFSAFADTSGNIGFLSVAE